MLTLVPVLLTLESLLSTSTAIKTLPRHDGPSRALSIPFRREEVPSSGARESIQRRQDDLSVINGTILNDAAVYRYLMNLSIGNPPQNLTVILDTGSSDLWLNTPKPDYCAGESRPCGTFGTFKPDDSETYQQLEEPFNIAYAGGGRASGHYATDTMAFGDCTLPELQFAVVSNTTEQFGVLGIGYPSAEALSFYDGHDPYRNLPARLAWEGYINSNAYSLWLNDWDASTGVILFGGVDRARYSGDLVTVPMLPANRAENTYIHIWITLSGLRLGSTDLLKDGNLIAGLDTGASVTYLPKSATDDIYKELGVQLDEEDSLPYVSCDLAETSDVMTFYFDYPASIDVLVKHLILDDPNQGNRCIFGILPTPRYWAIHALLGDTFLRSAYAVFDLENNEISLAQAKFNVTESDIVEIGSSNSSDGVVPGAIRASQTMSSSSSSPSSAPSASHSAGGDEGESAGYAVVMPSLAVVLVVGVGVVLGREVLW